MGWFHVAVSAVLHTPMMLSWVHIGRAIMIPSYKGSFFNWDWVGVKASLRKGAGKQNELEHTSFSQIVHEAGPC